MTKSEKLFRLKDELLRLCEIGYDQFEMEDFRAAEQILIDTIMTLTTSQNYDQAREICDLWRDIPKPYDE